MNKRWRRLSAVLLVIVMTISYASVSMAATNNNSYIRTYLEDDEILFDVHPFMMEGTIFAGFRGIFEALGYVVKYDYKTKIVTGTSPRRNLQINLLTNELTIDGGAYIKNPPKPIVIKGRTMVPIRFISEASGLTVTWIPDQRIIKLTYNKPVDADYDAIKALLQKQKSAAVKGDLTELLSTFDQKSALRNDYDGTPLTIPALSATTFEDIKILSWAGNKVTISYKATTKGTGEGFFLNREDLVQAVLTRSPVGEWKLFDIQIKKTTYTNADDKSLVEAAVPQADKAAILAVIDANEKALNDENLTALNATYNADASFTKQLTDQYTPFFKKYNVKFTNEVERIVYFNTSTAYVYIVQKSEEIVKTDYVNKRVYFVCQVNKDKNGIWKMNTVSQTISAEKL